MLKQTIRPEFLNRIDNDNVHATEAQIREVVLLQLDIEKQLAETALFCR